MDILLTLLIMILCLAAEAFFSGSEIGIVSADRIQLRHEAAKGSKGAKLALEMLKKPEWLLSTTLVGTNISVVLNTTMATALMIQLYGAYGHWLAIAVVAPLIWIFGEIVPKSIFQQRANAITPYSIYVLKFASYVFYPILILFSFLTKLLTRRLGGKSKSPFTLREQLITMMHMSAVSGDIQKVEQDMIRRMFQFTETTVVDIMVPLAQVAAINSSVKCGKAMKVAVRQTHKRLPVYQDKPENVIGTIDAFELLGRKQKLPITALINEVRIVPESKSIKELLFEFRCDGDAFAIVSDESGNTKGIVTLEDIMEEVVQDIEDEFDATS